MSAGKTTARPLGPTDTCPQWTWVALGAAAGVLIMMYLKPALCCEVSGSRLDQLWNVLVWCLERFSKLGGPLGELREPPEASSSHDSRCCVLGGVGSQGSQMLPHL